MPLLSWPLGRVRDYRFCSAYQQEPRSGLIDLYIAVLGRRLNGQGKENYSRVSLGKHALRPVALKRMRFALRSRYCPTPVKRNVTSGLQPGPSDVLQSRHVVTDFVVSGGFPQYAG